MLGFQWIAVYVTSMNTHGMEEVVSSNLTRSTKSDQVNYIAF